ncbi:MAG TPA: NADPH-dependent FMN reductase [Devosiaceae bacterium]|jgi:NAD(P)H-dependent FMN reductase
MRILAISGSLRAASSNTSALQAAALLAPEDVDIILFNGLDRLPHFNPDLDTGEPADNAVKTLRSAVGRSDGILISSPEYAHALPGSLKNALDWLVSSLEFPGKPIALINTAPRASHAQAQLREILTTMSAHLVDSASITLALTGRNLDAAGIANDAELSGQLDAALRRFAAEIAGLNQAD